LALREGKRGGGGEKRGENWRSKRKKNEGRSAGEKGGKTHHFIGRGEKGGKPVQKGGAGKNTPDPRKGKRGKRPFSLPKKRKKKEEKNLKEKDLPRRPKAAAQRGKRKRKKSTSRPLVGVGGEKGGGKKKE